MCILAFLYDVLHFYLEGRSRMRIANIRFTPKK